MKKIYLFSFGVFFGIFAKAQTVTYSYGTPAKVITLSDLTSIDVSPKNTASLPISLEFKISKIPDGVTLTATVTDKGDGAALLDNDYTYKTDLSKPIALMAVKNDGTSKTFTIDFNKAPSRQTSANFYVRIQNSGKLDKTYKVTVNFNSSDDLATSKKNNPSKITSPDTSKWYLRIVTGGNFDFFNGPAIKDFAGDLTAFIPNIIKIGGVNIGMEFSINNYHYFSSDSSHTEYYNQAYFLHNKDYYSPTDTAKVVKGSQSITGKYNYNVWGLHTDPIFYITGNDFAQLYAKIHVEELATTVTYTPTLANPVNDTITFKQYKTLSPVMPNAHATPYFPSYQNTYYDFYLGAGLPFVINIKNTATLSISPSFGFVSLQKAAHIYLNDPIHRDTYLPGQSSRETKLYTLNKFQLVTTVSAINVALGGENRTVAGNMHYFTTYLGAAITLDKLK